jgi:hypothetical protein
MVLRNLIIISLISLPFILQGQSDTQADRNGTVLIERLKGDIKFDGIPDDETWGSIIPMDLIMYSPVFGKESTEKSDIRLGFDDKYLYAGAWINYRDAGMIRSASFKRDYMGMGGDWFIIILDTYNDKKNAVMFATTPDGLRFDAGIQRDAVVSQPDEMPMNLNWNTFWDVLTKRDSKGWSTEMRVPLSSLRFHEVNGEVKMGIIIQRWIPASNETDIFPAIPPNWGDVSTIKPSQAQEVVFHGLKSGRPIYIVPYGLTGYESKNELNDKETDYLHSNKPAFEPGLDVKFGLSANMIMDLTANTDFAQVEADDQQINLTRYSLYFPEKRMFFLERADVFDFAMSDNNNLFYSRRIGLSEDGDPVRIYGGARLTGRIKKWDVGILDMQTAPLHTTNSAGLTEDILPSENFGVMRFRRQAINENSYVGAMTTSRIGADGSYNIGYGLDGIFHVFGDDYLDIKWSQTFEDSIPVSSVMDPSRLMAKWERRSRIGLGYDLEYSQSGKHYNPGIGFEMIDDYAVVETGLRYGWLSPEKSKLYTHSPMIRMKYMTYIDDRSLMSFSSFNGWSFRTKNQWQAEMNLIYSVEILRDSLELKEDEVYIPPDKYQYLSFMGFVVTPMSKPFFIMTMTETGQFYDGTRLSLHLEPTWNVSSHLELGGTYNFDRVNFSKRNLKMVNHIIGLKALYMLNTRLSANAFIQYNTAVNEIITNFRIRYNPKEGNDLYLVFNEGRNTNLIREVPNLPVYNSRAVMIKYTYTFNL